VAKTKFLPIPLTLLRELTHSNATVLAYIRYRLRFNITFIESNEQIGKNLGLSENGVAKIIRKLKADGFVDYSCKRHGSITLGSKAHPDNNKVIHKAYCRVMWIAPKGRKYFEEGN
jgi:hypothetical protein